MIKKRSIILSRETDITEIDWHIGDTVIWISDKLIETGIVIDMSNMVQYKKSCSSYVCVHYVPSEQYPYASTIYHHHYNAKMRNDNVWSLLHEYERLRSKEREKYED